MGRKPPPLLLDEELASIFAAVRAHSHAASCVRLASRRLGYLFDVAQQDGDAAHVDMFLDGDYESRWFDTFGHVSCDALLARCCVYVTPRMLSGGFVHDGRVIGDVIARTLASSGVSLALRRARTVTLFLDSCPERHECAALASLQATHPKLRFFFLHPGAAEHAVAHLVSLPSGVPRLSELCLQNGTLNASDVVTLLNGIDVRELRALDLSSNPIDSSAVRGLAALATRAPRLDYVSLNGTAIGNRGAVFLASALDPGLRRLHLADMLPPLAEPFVRCLRRFNSVRTEESN